MAIAVVANQQQKQELVQLVENKDKESISGKNDRISQGKQVRNNKHTFQEVTIWC